MDKKKLDELRKTCNAVLYNKSCDYKYVATTDIEFLLDRADKCDELEAKCKKYENALKFYSDGLHYRIENSDMMLENGEVAAEALGVKRDNPPNDQVVEGINLTDGVEFNNDFRALEAKCDELEKRCETGYAQIERLKGELDESNRKLEHAKLAIILAKEQYWNKCYQGSGNVQAMTLNKFTAFMEEALKAIGVES